VGQRSYYDQKDEWSRLETPTGRLEFRRTMDLIEKHLPASGRILDLGGGPGRYTIALAQRGYRVRLADASPRQLEAARQRIAEVELQGRVEGIDEVDSVDLGNYDDASFDAVLALGPFYHLMARADRLRAALEIRRVVKPRGRVVVSFIPRLWGAAGLIHRAAADPEQVTPENFRETLRTGAFCNERMGAFEGFFADPLELRMLFEEAKFLWVETVSLRGIADRYEEALWTVEQSQPALFAEFYRAIAATADDPAVIAAGGHAAIVVQRPLLG